jgi:hypothetical protein
MLIFPKWKSLSRGASHTASTGKFLLSKVPSGDEIVKLDGAVLLFALAKYQKESPSALMSKMRPITEKYGQFAA